MSEIVILKHSVKTNTVGYIIVFMSFEISKRPIKVSNNYPKFILIKNLICSTDLKYLYRISHSQTF